MNSKKSKVVILIFLFLILFVLISIYCWVNMNIKVRNGIIDELSVQEETELEDINPATLERMENVTLEVLEDSITKDSLELVITDPNDPQFGWRPGFRIQEKVDDNWIDLEPKKRLEFTEIGYKMNENHQVTETIDFGKCYKLKKNSIYRVVKPVYAGTYINFYSNEFSIK